MLQFIMRKFDEQGEMNYQRIYYETTYMGTSQFLGSASKEDLRNKLNTSRGNVLTIKFPDEVGNKEISLSSLENIMLDGDYIVSGTVCRLQLGSLYKLQLGFLSFEIEVKEY